MDEKQEHICKWQLASVKPTECTWVGTCEGHDTAHVIVGTMPEQKYTLALCPICGGAIEYHE